MANYQKIVKNPSHRSAITKIRISAHRYPIETGRYNHTVRPERECPMGCQVLGDETHYVLNCSHPFISRDRRPILDSILVHHPELNMLDNRNKCIAILNVDDPASLGLVGKLCHRIEETFKEITI